MLPNNDSSRTSIVINKALSLFKLRDYTDAIKYFDKALSIFPANADLREDRMQAVRAFHNSTK
ncbi:MAG: tetratricopeptide repeat protein [Candidatus Nitrosopolaris sp.]